MRRPYAGSRRCRSDRRTLRGRRRYSVPLLHGSTETLATRPLEAAHKSSGYSSWRCPKNSSSLTTFSCLMNTVSRCRCPLPHHIPFLFSLHSASPRGGGLSPIPTPGLGLHKRFVGFGWGSSGLRLSYRAVRDGSRDYGLNIDGCGLRGSTRDYLKLDRAGDKS